MGQDPSQSDADEMSEQQAQHDQLRTISFRMREIQRLLAIRVEQENRRLEAEGLEPVTESRFREQSENE